MRCCQQRKENFHTIWWLRKNGANRCTEKTKKLNLLYFNVTDVSGNWKEFKHTEKRVHVRQMVSGLLSIAGYRLGFHIEGLWKTMRKLIQNSS
jgi:hypothetical protein